MQSFIQGKALEVHTRSVRIRKDAKTLGYRGYDGQKGAGNETADRLERSQEPKYVNITAQ